MPITWKNVNAPDLRGAADILKTGSDLFSSGLNKIGGVATDIGSGLQADYDTQTNEINEGLLTGVAGATSPEQLALMKQQLAQAGSQYGADRVDALKVTNAINAKEQALRDDSRKLKLQGRQDTVYKQQQAKIAREEQGRLASDVAQSWIDTNYTKDVNLDVGTLTREFQDSKEYQSITDPKQRELMLKQLKDRADSARQVGTVSAGVLNQGRQQLEATNQAGLERLNLEFASNRQRLGLPAKGILPTMNAGLVSKLLHDKEENEVAYNETATAIGSAMGLPPGQLPSDGDMYHIMSAAQKLEDDQTFSWGDPDDDEIKQAAEEYAAKKRAMTSKELTQLEFEESKLKEHNAVLASRENALNAFERSAKKRARDNKKVKSPEEASALLQKAFAKYAPKVEKNNQADPNQGFTNAADKLKQESSAVPEETLSESLAGTKKYGMTFSEHIEGLKGIGGVLGDDISQLTEGLKKAIREGREKEAKEFAKRLKEIQAG